MITKTINEYDFVNEFSNSDTYKDKYSRLGLFALYDYLDQLSEDIGENIELDIVAIACDYTEYETAWEAMEQYQPEDMPTPHISDDENPDLIEIQEKSEALALEWLQDRTTVITFDGGIIIQNF